VREHEELVFISTNGMVQRTSVRGINRYGRASQGVRVMNLKDEDLVSAVALVAEGNGGVGNGDLETAADGGNGATPPVAEAPQEPVDDDLEVADDGLEVAEDELEQPVEDEDGADE
jgi:DNA gyrase subunit A